MRNILKNKWVKIVTLIVFLIICFAVVSILIYNKKSKSFISVSSSSQSSTNQIPAPYNNFDYLYTGGYSPNGLSGQTSYFSYINKNLIQSTSTSTAIFSDGEGFYQVQDQTEQTIPCGDKQLDAASYSIDGFAQECISVNGNDYLVTNDTTSPFYVNKSYVIYEECQKMSYSVEMTKNECDEFFLKVNNTVIDTSEGGSGDSFANDFYDIEVNGNILTYIKIYNSSDTFLGEKWQFISYDLSSNTKTIEYSAPDNTSIFGAQLVDGKPILDLDSFSGVDPSKLQGMSSDDQFMYIYAGNNDSLALLLPDQTEINNVRGFASNDGHLYTLQWDTPVTKSDPYPSEVLLKDNVAVLSFVPGNQPSGNSIGIYPDCSFEDDDTVCLYGDGNYLAQTGSGVDKDTSADITNSQSLFKNYVSGESTYAGGDIYYPNGLLAYNFFGTNMDLPFVFSSNGDTYLVYYLNNVIYGEDISTGSQPVKLFEVDLPGYPSITQLRVFPKNSL